MPELEIAGKRVHFIETAGAPETPPSGRLRPAVVLIHGAGGDHTVWGEQLSGLRGAIRLLIPDLSGHGRSASTDDASIPAHARVIRELILRTGLIRPLVAGHSMGGGIALQAALDDPGLVGGVLLIASGARLAVAARVFEMIEQDPREAIREIARTAYGPQTPDEMVERGVATLSRSSPAVLTQDFRACDAFDVRDRLGSLAVPLRILCGSADRLMLPKFAEKLAASVPGAKLRIIAGAGHLLMIERPEEVNRELAGFVEEVAGAPAPDVVRP